MHSLVFGLQYQGSGKWGRRRPRWLMVERTYLHSLWRASQAAHKSQATSDHPSAPLDRIPPMHKVSMHCTMLSYMLHMLYILCNVVQCSCAHTVLLQIRVKLESL